MFTMNESILFQLPSPIDLQIILHYYKNRITNLMESKMETLFKIKK